jgi:hypothetical protein
MPLRRANTTESISFCVCSKRPDVEIQIHRVDTEPLRGVRQRLMLVPVVGNAAREADHLAKDGDLAVQRAPFAVRQLHGARRQAFDELIAAFGDDLDGVGRQQLIVAQRRRDRARPLIVFKPRLHVVIAVAADLEAVDAHDLFFGQSGRRGDPGVSAL